MHPLRLNHFALLKISGADAAQFLQGQLTNDVNLLNKCWHYSGYCSPKGRLLGLLTIWQHDDGFYALLNDSLVASVATRLKMFVLRSKVEIEHLTEAKVIGALQTPLNLSLASGEPMTVTAQNSGGLRYDRGAFVLDMGKRSIIVDPLGSVVSEKLEKDNDHRWLLEDINSGQPPLFLETAEMFVPQMLNLDLLDGINFKKGCYTGQEIVARMHYLGKLKQRMFVCNADAEVESAAAGTKILTAEGKNAGNLATPIVEGKCLAVLRIEHADATLHLDGIAASTLSVVKEQPYPIPLNTKE